MLGWIGLAWRGSRIVSGSRGFFFGMLGFRFGLVWFVVMPGLEACMKVNE